MGAEVGIAAILFGVLGFVYSVFATFSRRELPNMATIEETEIDLRPHPILRYLKRVAQWITIGLGLALLVSTGCFAWFLWPKDWILTVLACGLLGEVTFLFVIGLYITFWLMPVYS